MNEIQLIVERVRGIAKKYGFKISYIDETDVTVIIKIGIQKSINIYIYANTQKQKLNMALVVANIRVYGIDTEGGFYHEHPFENPLLHIPTQQVEIEDFVIKSIEILKEKGLL